MPPSPLQISLPLPRETYTPAIPSPLNPTSPPTPPPRRQSRGSPIRSARRTSGPVSPTQRLMRQKAAAAWQSLALENAVMSSASACEGGRRQSFAIEVEPAEKSDIVFEECSQGHLVEGLGFGGMGLDLVALDIEKQALINRDDFGAEASSLLPEHEYRQRGPRTAKRGRAWAALGILCIAGVMSVFCSYHGGSS
ncbi:hypothetical protein BJ170DRAFT_680620 [Xylariales sp. AK1849]|nr:hypothetical protein BJ170DRAFT_680620 [Xylariales sp. AK1849]